MSGYPVLLKLTGRRVALIGGGRVATRKVRDLIETGASLVVIAPALSPALQSLWESGRIEARQTVYQPGMLSALRPALVFAATDSPEVNRQVLEEAHKLGILANAADDAQGSDFHSMAAFRRGEIIAAVSTEGASPALSRHLRGAIEGVIGEEYAMLARWMGELRPVIRARIPSDEGRAAFWRSVIASDVLTLLKHGDEDGARKTMNDLVERWS
jgi:precorrin-2 dehydrogenase / sirohydrochlorin ferrochelatase